MRSLHPGLFEPRQSSATTRLIPHAEFKPGPKGFSVESVSDLKPDEHGLSLMDIVMEGTPAPLKDLHEIAQAISSGTLLPKGGTGTR